MTPAAFDIGQRTGAAQMRLVAVNQERCAGLMNLIAGIVIVIASVLGAFVIWNADKVGQIVGLASSVPYDRNDPMNPIDRRISIVVLNEEAGRELMGEPPTLAAEDLAASNATE